MARCDQVLPSQLQVSARLWLPSEPPKMTTVPEVARYAAAALLRPVGLAPGCSCDQEDPSQLQVSAKRAKGEGMQQPPNSTDLPVAGSKVRVAPDRPGGLVPGLSCVQSLLSQTQVSAFSVPSPPNSTTRFRRWSYVMAAAWRGS